MADRVLTGFDSGLSYRPGEPVTVHVVQREHRYDISDDGAAVRLAGKRTGWREVAGAVVDREYLNINRSGVVSVPAVAGRDIDALSRRVAATSRSVYLALLDLDS
jgi:hypothetical protein